MIDRRASLTLCVADVTQDGILPTKLYCTNVNVDAENSSRLAALPGQAVTFRSTDTFRGECTADAQQKLRDLVEKKAVASLDLKLGAQCLLTKNMPDLGLVNGSRGVVVGFEETWCTSPRLGQMPSTMMICSCAPNDCLPWAHRTFGLLCRCTSYGVPSGRYECPVVKFDSGQRLAVQPQSFFQGGPGGAVVRMALPLKLAWALTVLPPHT